MSVSFDNKQSVSAEIFNIYIGYPNCISPHTIVGYSICSASFSFSLSDFGTRHFVNEFAQTRKVLFVRINFVFSRFKYRFLDVSWFSDK